MKEKERFDLTGKVFILLAVLAGILFACKDEEDSPEPLVFSYEFSSGTEGWTGGFADYPEGNDQFYELLFEYAMLPEPLDETTGALKISGNNHSDDLFMFAKRKISGLEPNTEYEVKITIEFASNVPDGTPGVGGSPGESVYIKGGASQQEPQPVVDDANWYRMNIDKGNQSQDGEDMLVLGDFSNDTGKNEYTLKTVSNSTLFPVTSDENGALWLIVGTDSAFEATTTIFFNRITFEFRK